MMFERFTERARQVLVLAQDEARNLGHDYIGTEHILLGLLREEEGVAAAVLMDGFKVTLDGARAQVARLTGQGGKQTMGQLPFTPRAKKVLDLSLREALALGHNYIGTEHVLLGLLREGEQAAPGPGLQVLHRFADSFNVREAVIRKITKSDPSKPAAETPTAGTASFGIAGEKGPEKILLAPAELQAIVAEAVEKGVLEGLRRALSWLNL